MVLCLLFQNSVKLEALAEACYRFTPRMALRESERTAAGAKQEALFLHLTEGPSELLKSKLQILCGRFGLKDHQMAWGTAAPQALVLARAKSLYSERSSFSTNGGELSLSSLPLSLMGDLLSPFALNPDLNRRWNVQLELLQKLGLHTFGDFMALPLSGLGSRWGAEAILARRILSGEHDFPWPPFQRTQKIEEEEDLESRDIFVPVETLEPLLFLLRSLVTRVVARLHGRNERAVRVRLDFVSRRSSLSDPLRVERRSWEFGFPVPQKSFQTIFDILKERIFFELQKKPLESPVSCLRLEVLETAPGGARQRDFFRRREEERENWAMLVARLCQKLGEEKVFSVELLSRHRPESAWRPQLNEPVVEEKALPLPLLGLPQRPTRLWSAPRTLRRDGNRLWDRELGRAWTVKQWEGPERLSGEWWSGNVFDRHYYRVFTEEGEVLWLFVERDHLYWHGIFD